MDWLLSPLLPLALFSLGTVAQVLFYFRLHHANARLRARLEELSQRIQREGSPPPCPDPPSGDLVLNHQQEALRLHAAGCSTLEIARRLKAPSREVHLLIQLHADN